MTRIRAAVTVLAAGALGLVGGCGEGTSPSPTPTPTGDGTSPSPSPSPSPTPDEPPPIAAVTAEGEVVLIDPESGERRENLADGVDTSDPAANAIASSPSTVYVAYPAQDAPGGEIREIDVETGESTTIADGGAPAVSPDGTTLAYTVAEDGMPPEPTIVLRDLDSGDERVLRSEESEPYFYIAELTWTADGSELVFMAGEITTGLQAVPADAASLDDARRLGPEDTEQSWRASAALGDGRLAVVSVTGDDPADPEAWNVVVVDVGTGDVVDEPLPRDRVEAAALASREGRLALTEGGGPAGGTLLLWDGDDELRELADGVVALAW